MVNGNYSPMLSRTQLPKGTISTKMQKERKVAKLAINRQFGYSQNGRGTFSEFLIFFSSWLYLSIPRSSDLKAAPKYPKSCPEIIQNHHFGPPYLRPWGPPKYFNFGYELVGPYQSNDYDMVSFTDFRSVRACNTYAAGHVK